MNEPTALKRPKPSDDEDELLRMQDEFLKSQQEPSAKVINLRAQNNQNKDAADASKVSKVAESGGRILSKFAERKALKQQKKLSTAVSSGLITNDDVTRDSVEGNVGETVIDRVQNLPMDLSHIIVGNIVETKHPREPTKVADISGCEAKGPGFPKVFVVDQKHSTGDGSLFWQSISKTSNPSSTVPQMSSEKRPDFSAPLSTDPTAQEIHLSNVEKLNQMTTEEILKAKAELESAMDPDILKYLKARKNIGKKLTNADTHLRDNVEKIQRNETTYEKTENKAVSEKINDEEKSKSIEEVVVKMDCDVDEVEKETPIGELIEQAETKGWMHMDTIETKKLEWMKDVASTNKEDPKPNEPYNARFDFNGVLLPFRDDELSINEGLHHHGEEPERPGYSLQELLQLSRSTSQQQRCTAIATIANIMEKSRAGWYDKVLNPQPLVALNEKNIFLLLRMSLDDTALAVITVSLRAIRAFLYSEADEVCLDRLYGWRYVDGKFDEPELPAPCNDVKDTSDLKDHELGQLDTVAAAMRTDIVLRVRYILSEVRPPPVGVTSALDILTRLARQSRTTALNIACTSNLLDVVVRNFITCGSDRSILEGETRDAYGVPNSTAVRFCRVLVSYAGKPVADRLNNLNIVRSLLSYVTIESTGIGIRLSIESLRLWKLMLSHNVALDSIAGARLAFVSQLQLLLSNHDLGSSSELSCEYAGALIDVATYETSLRTIISELLTKWSVQLSTVSSPTWGQTKLIAQTMTALGDVTAFKCTWTADSKIFANLCSTSNLLSGCTPTTERDPSSLPNLGVLTQDGHLQPALSTNSPIPFLATWINLFTKNSQTIHMQNILENPNFVKYARRLSTNDWSLENSWYTRAELYLATGIVRAAMSLGASTNDYVNQVTLNIAIKLISALPADASKTVCEILQIVLSNERINVEKLSNDLRSLKLENSSISCGKIPNLPNNLSLIYEKYVTNDGTWCQAAMPKDWLYLPLVAAYSDHKNKIKWNDIDTTKIVVILSLELSMPELTQNLSPSLRFSRLVLVYLCDTVCLNDDISILLDETIGSLLKKYYKRLDFTSDLPGLTSFTDLFTSMCECFCANSYGNDGFSMAIVVPLAQRHDVHYRKLLWSEHAGALRYLRLGVDKLVVPLKEYLYPIEEDSTLIESYLTALVRGTVQRRWSPLMHAIALHHSAMFIKGEQKLAVRMRRKIGELRDVELSQTLLNYTPIET